MSEQLAFFAPIQQPPPRPAEELLREEFAAFWQAVPKHPNSVKAISFASYRKARESGATAQEIMAGVGRYRWSPDPCWRPHVTTWLNQGRFRVEGADLAADPWGIGEWLTKLLPAAGPSAGMYGRETLEQIMSVTGWDATWRGDLSPLNEWLRDGYLPNSITTTLNAAVGRHGTRASLKAFDGWVRHHAERFQCRDAAE